MKKVTRKPKALYTRDALSRIIAILELVKKLKYPSLNKLADALEYDEGFKRFSRRTLIRDIIYLRDSCQYPIFFDWHKLGYCLDWEKGKQEGFLPKLVKDPGSIGAVPPETPRPPVAALPEGESLAATLRWAALKIRHWEEGANSLDLTHRVGIVYRGCQILEGLLAHALSILLTHKVRTDDLAMHGRFEEQLVLLLECDPELTELIQQRLPGTLRGKTLCSAADRALLEELRHLREKLLKPPTLTLRQQQKEVPQLFVEFLPRLKAVVESDLLRTCAALEPHQRALRRD